MTDQIARRAVAGDRRQAAAVLASYASRPWAVSVDPFAHLAATLDADASGVPPDVRELAVRRGAALENARTARVRDGVATIPVRGILLERSSWLEDYGYSSYETIARDLEVALEDDSVRAVIFDVDSPGGLAHGSAELADIIFAARDRKPIVAYVGGLAASAGYKIAAACGQVVAHETAELGSIGTVAPFLDMSGMLAMMGLKLDAVVSEVSPKKWLDPATPEGRAEAQRVVNALGEDFVGRVARYRGTTRERVVADFGGGSTLVGAGAVDAGLADRLGSYEQLLAELAGTGAGGGPPAARPASPGESTAARPARRNAMSDEMRQLHSLIDRAPADKRKTLLDSLRGMLGFSTDPPADGGGPAATAAPAGREARPAPPSDEVDYKARYEALVGDRRAGIPTEAAAFALGEIEAGRATPADRERLERDFTEAAEDDLKAPRQVRFTVDGAERTGTRVERLRALAAATPEHGLTTRQVDQTATRAVLAGQQPGGGQKSSTEVGVEQAKKYAESRKSAGSGLTVVR